MSEQVDHPAHYGGKDNPYEVIKVLEAWLTPEQMVGFLKGNTIKYVARSEKKGGKIDTGKASWYVRYLADFEERHPNLTHVDGAVHRQLQKSMELNAKLKNAVRELRQGIMTPLVSSEGPPLISAELGDFVIELDKILRLT